MPDFFDRVQERVLTDTAAAIERATRQRQPGLAECEECGQAISELRRGMGARLCIAHQQALEARGRR